jgi:hypothetical protein
MGYVNSTPAERAVASELAELREAVDALSAAAAAASERWSQSPGPERWSPGQIVEHVAMTLDESAKVAAGKPSRFPELPPFVRPFVRWLFLNPALRKSAIPRGVTTPAFNPAQGLATMLEGRVRLSRALLEFDQAVRLSAARGPVVRSTVFGTVSASRFVRFQALHTRHHIAQLQAGR